VTEPHERADLDEPEELDDEELDDQELDDQELEPPAREEDSEEEHRASGAGVALPADVPADDDEWPDEEHAAGVLDIPDAVDLIEGEPKGARRRVAVVVSRFNGDVTNRLLRRALLELEDAGVTASLVTVMPVPGAFELPLGAMALAKTRRFACVVALGCVVRGETPHFDYVAGEAASGLQLAALETGVPVSFGVLTVESVAQAEARLDRAADAVRSALEMADVFAQLRSAGG
jgi:6,7-dimethyl-8-ribityllumazine synthase